MTTVPQFSYNYRMGAGFVGDVNRAHPFTVEPAFNDASNPVLTAGLACVINAAGTGVRSMASGDTALTALWGVTVRAFPTQDPGTNETYGTVSTVVAEPLIAGSGIDVLRSGYIMVPIVGTVAKGGTVYVWVAASGAGHTQGGFESGATGGSTCQLADAFFNGPADANGIGELEFNV